MRAVDVVLLVCAALGARTLMALHPHSGQGTPPLFGDYEAQRHWYRSSWRGGRRLTQLRMEITSHLPATQWYHNGTDNDLQYWGLDYPPLTAYHSALLGRVGRVRHPAAFALRTSRGAEDAASKCFMRSTVLVSDVLVYIPAVILHAATSTGSVYAALFALVQPALLLVDHGHFQYNGVCLGLVAWAVTAINNGDELLGSVLFVFAMCFKHMALYFAPAFGVVLLARNLRRPAFGVGRIALLGCAVLLSVAVVLWPLRDDVGQVVARMFPVGRGLFEDKVANVWCAISPVVKLKMLNTPDQLFKFSAFVTLLSIVPSVALLAHSPTRVMFKLSLASVSLCAFLFGFQVHEKSILMPLLPLSLLWPLHPVLATWSAALACFSMFPLLLRDGLALAYTSCMLALLGVGRWSVLTVASLLPVAAIHAVWALVPPPSSLPYLYEQLCVSYSFVCFVAVLLVLHVLQWQQVDDE